MRRFAISLLAAGSLVPFSSPAFAQEGPDAATQDDVAAEDNAIVVTAQRRSEKVTDVPISITVVGADQLERQQVNTVGDLARVSPSLEINSGSQAVGGGGSIRGVGTQTFSAGAQASVGIVVDQVAQGNVNISDLVDIARVEVLKGPQGTLFGLTTSAGVINITTNSPDPREVSGRIRTEISGAGFAGSKYGQQVVQGVINLPVSETSALRLAGSVNFRQGAQRNTLLHGRNHFERVALRGRFLWEPNDDLTVNLIADYSNARGRGSDFFTFIQNSPIFVRGAPATNRPDLATLMATCGVTVREGNPDYCTTLDIRTRDKSFGAAASIDYDLGGVTLTSISAYRGSRAEQNYQSIFRSDPLANTALVGAGNATFIIADPHQKESNNLYTQELRLSSPTGDRLEYTLGGFFSHLDNRQQPRSTSNLQPGRPVSIQQRGLIDITDESYALFGQATFHATDALRLIGGARYTHSKLSYTQTRGVQQAANRDTSKEISWRLGAQFDVAPSTMIYATANRGFKGGQITVSNDIAVVPQIIKPELPMAYEAGLKTTLFDSLVLDLNIFHQDVKNFQAQNCTLNVTTGLFSCAQINIDKVRAVGGEINLFGKISENLSLSTGFIYAKTTYESDNPVLGKTLASGTIDMRGRQIAFAPRYKFTLSGEYQQPLSSAINAFLGVDTVWKSRIRYQQSVQEAETFRPHWTVGGRIGIRTEDERLTTAIFVRNLFNIHEPVTMQQPLANSYRDATAAIYGPSAYRQVGLSVDLKF